MMVVQPKLAVVLVTQDSFATLRRTVRALRAQTIAEQVEIMIVAPTAETVADCRPGELDGFARVEIVPAGPIVGSVDNAAPKGMLRATAPIVALAEDHVFYAANWAEEIVKAHAGPWAVVNGRMINANPRSAMSRANALVVHLAELEPTPGERKQPFTSHNASYKREVLERYGERLESYMGRDGGLMRDLLSRGYRLYIHPEARYHHLQPSRWWPMMLYHLCAGQNYAAKRVREEGWGWGRRLAYVFGAPLIPFVRLARLIPHAKRFGQLPRVLPPILLSLIVDAMGEAVGYAAGSGRSREILADFEVRRPRYMSRRDRDAYEAAANEVIPHLVG